VSVLWKPIWLARSFSFCAPFIAIALGALVGRLLSGPRRLPAGGRAVCGLIVVAALGATGWFAYHEQITPWKTQYREAAAFLRDHVRAGDVIYMPEHYTFWGISRYLIGPQWGSLLAVQDPVNQDRSAIWPKIYARLGTRGLDFVHLRPQTRKVDGFKAPLYIGWSPLPPLPASEGSSPRSVWIAGSDELSLDALGLCPHGQAEVASFVQLRIYRIECAGGAT
jgi:hypothetical protein